MRLLAEARDTFSDFARKHVHVRVTYVELHYQPSGANSMLEYDLNTTTIS